MRPAIRLLMLIPLALGALLLGGIVLSLLVSSSVTDTLFFVGIGSTVFGGLLVSGRRKSLEDLPKKAYITGGGRLGDVRVLPRSQPEPSQESEKLATPSGMRSTEHVENGVPSWLTGATIGLVMIVAGVIMMVSLYLLGLH